MNKTHLTIGQLSTLTGIKTITLRAWERRYGLLVPQRQTSGHRLYNLSDVDKIREIRFWLNQGISISKVQHHLKNIHDKNPQEDPDLSVSLEQLVCAVLQYDQARLKQEIDTIFALYPIDFFIEKILPDILTLLGKDNLIGVSFFKNIFRHKLRESILSARHSKESKKLLIARSMSPYGRMDVLGLSAILSVYDYSPTVLESPILIERIPDVMALNKFDGFVLFTDSSPVAMNEIKKISDRPWLKMIVSPNQQYFDKVKGVSFSQDNLNSMLHNLKKNLL